MNVMPPDWNSLYDKLDGIVCVFITYVTILGRFDDSYISIPTPVLVYSSLWLRQSRQCNYSIYASFDVMERAKARRLHSILKGS
jgi:hypothetical protein